MADEKKHRNIRDKLLIEAGANPSFNFADGANGEDFYEPTDSDALPDVDHELPEDDLDNPPVVAKDDDGQSVIPKEAKHRFKDRIPGEVVRMKPGDFELDPVTGCYVLKKQPEAVVKPKRVKKLNTADQSAEKSPKLEKSPLSRIKNLKPVELPAALAKPKKPRKPAQVDEAIAATKLRATAKKTPKAAPAKKPKVAATAVKKPAVKKAAPKKTATKKAK
jgi:hypothetical protein